MHLTELHTFLAIIETGSLVRASEQLNVTQSTVTARLKSLEMELGQPLIHRQKSGASLTAAGVRLQRYANTISELWQQARQETALPDAMSAVVNFGCHPDLWHNLGERIFDYVRTTIPNAALTISQGNQTDLAAWLNDGLIDLSLTYSSNPNQKQEVITAFEDRLIVVSTEPAASIRFNPDYVFVEAGEEFGRQHAATYSDAGTAKISFNTAQLGLEYLLQHGGSAYLPDRIARSRIEDGSLFELTYAPVFDRRAFLTINNSAREAWSWLDECLESIPDSPKAST